ncbi:MAG: hypothetical protein Q9178_005924 [Gyalolechia marmorata]
MLPIPELLNNYIPHEQSLQFPFDSLSYDPFLANGLRCKRLLQDTIRLSERSQVAYYEVVDGEGYLFDGLDLDDKKVARAVYQRSDTTDGSLRVFFILQSDDRRAFSISRPALEVLLKRMAVPIRFLELLANNNGCYQAYTQFNESGAESFLSEYVGCMEPRRMRLDVLVREMEAKTGMSGHVFHESLRAAANDLGDLLKDLHVCEGNLAFFERTVHFQVGWIEWLQAQHIGLNQLRFGTGEIINIPHVQRPIEEGVASSLNLGASISRESLEQVRTLRNRIRIQLSVVANLIAQNDSRTNISIADASRRIAFETRRDSDAMKTIAALTMVFLPATFVATLFGMVFFTVDSGSGSGFRVNSLWWVYLAVTIPLTMLTVGVWRGWLGMVRRSRIQDEESVGLKEKAH